MSAVDEIVARLELGETIKPEDYAIAKAADELDELTRAAAIRSEAERDDAERRAGIVAELTALWADVDAATDAAEREYRKFIKQHAELCEAVDRMQSLALAARSFAGKHRVTAEDVPPLGRGSFDIDALGASTVKVAIAGGSHEIIRWPVAGMYFGWVRNRRNEGGYE